MDSSWRNLAAWVRRSSRLVGAGASSELGDVDGDGDGEDD
jgi:hypothetical protein